MPDQYSDSQADKASKLEKYLAKIDKAGEIKSVIIIYDDGACIFSKGEQKELPEEGAEARQFKYYWGFPPGRRP